MPAFMAACKTVIPSLTSTGWSLIVSLISWRLTSKIYGLSLLRFRFCHYRDWFGGNINFLSGNLRHSAESLGANAETGIALGALTLVDNVHHPPAAGDSLNRAVPEANLTSFTLVGEDVIVN